MAAPGPTAPAVATDGTFAAHYADAVNDPFDGEYAVAMTAMRSTNAPPSGADLLSEVVNTSGSFPSCFVGLYATAAHPEGLSLMLFGVRRYPSVAFGATTPWQNHVFVFAGDIIRGLATSAYLPRGSFEILPVSHNVPGTPERVDELLVQNPGVALLGPFADAEANIRQTRTRSIMFVPPQYVPLLAERRLTPRELWEQLVGAIRANDDLDNCKELVDWVLLTLVQAPTTGTSCVVKPNPPQVPIPDTDLVTHRQEVLLAQCPGASRAVDGPSPTTNAQLAVYFGTLTEEARLTRLANAEAAAAKKAPKLPSAHWNEGASLWLCFLCDVDDETKLPDLWLQLAKGVKDRRAVDAAVSDVARDMEKLNARPIITPDLAQKIAALRFAGNDFDDLSDGVQPFALLVEDQGDIGFVTQTELSAARANAENYDDMTDNNVTSTLADTNKLRSKAMVRLPTDYVHVRALLQAQGILLRTMHGETHPLTVKFGAFLDKYLNEELYFRRRMQGLTTYSFIVARFLRFVQLRILHYYRDARDNYGRTNLPRPPDFNEALTGLRYSTTGWIPELPAGILKSPPNVIHSGGTGGMAVSSATPSVVSALTSATGAMTTTSTTVSTKASRKVPNPTANAAFLPYKAKLQDGKIREVIEAAGPPPDTVRQGSTVPMCVMYHVRGACKTDCPRAADHGAHSAAEEQQLLAWCARAMP